jgi:hypothetical protein
VAVSRPSQLAGPAGLEGVDGVSAFCLKTHGAQMLAALLAASQRLGLPMDAGRAAAEAAAAARRAQQEQAARAASNALAAFDAASGAPVAAAGPTRWGGAALAPASGASLGPQIMESLRSWSSGLSCEQIGAARAPKPCSAELVCGHVFTAARAGQPIDWGRMAREMGVDQPGGLSWAELSFAVASARAATPAGEAIKLRAVRDALPQPQTADAMDARKKGAGWSALKFALLAVECGVQTAPAERPEEAVAGHKRPREEEPPPADAELLSRAVGVIQAVAGGVGRAALEAQLGVGVGNGTLTAALEAAAGDGIIYESAPGVWHAL